MIRRWWIRRAGRWPRRLRDERGLLIFAWVFIVANWVGLWWINHNYRRILKIKDQTILLQQGMISTLNKENARLRKFLLSPERPEAGI